MIDNLKSGGQFQLFSEVYGFLKSWANDLPKSDSAWSSVVSEADALGAKYRGTGLEPLSVSLIMSVVNELERLSRMA